MIHTEYTISLNRLAEMLETNNKRLILCWGWLPGYFIRLFYSGFLLRFTEMFNQDELDQRFEDEMLRVKIYNRVNNLLPSLYMGLVLDMDDRFKEIYKELFHMDYEGEVSLKRIATMINKLTTINSEIEQSQVNKVNKKGIPLSKMIAMVEIILDLPIDRKMKLYHFKYQYNIALEKIAKMNTDG